MPIKLLYVKITTLLMHDVHKNSLICSLFPTKYTVTIPDLQLPVTIINCSRLNQHKISFSIIGCKIWNGISGKLKNLPKHFFKKKIATILFQNLPVYGSCVNMD